MVKHRPLVKRKCRIAAGSSLMLTAGAVNWSHLMEVDHALNVWTRGLSWFQSNTMRPPWLPARWRHWSTGYVAAALLQCAAVAIMVQVSRVLPAFPFLGTLEVLAIALVAVWFGTGPSLTATLLGAILLNFVVLPVPAVAPLTIASRIAATVLFLAVGGIVSILPGQVERGRASAEVARQQAEAARARAEQLTASLAAEQARLEAIFDATPDRFAIFDAQGRLVRLNATAQLAAGPERGTEGLSQYQTVYDLRRPTGEPWPDDELPLARALRGEHVSDVEMLYRGAEGDDQIILTSVAPFRDAQGRVQGAMALTRDITSQHLLKRRTREALDAVLAMAQMLVELPGDRVDAEVAEAPDAERSEAAAAQRLALLTRGVLGCKRVGITAVNPDTQRMRAIAVVGLTSEQESQWWAEQRELERQGMRLGDGSDPANVERFRGGEVLVIDMTHPPYADLPNPYGVTTTLVAPMRVGQQVMGMLSLDYGGPPHHFTEDEIALASAVAHLGAVVLEREQLLREREDALAQALALRETNRLMDEFMSIASHELRTPLTTITANLQLAARRLEKLKASATGGVSSDPDATARMEQIRAMLAQASAAVNRQQRLINDLLDASRVQNGKLDMQPAPFDLVDLVRECVEEQRLIQPERALDVELPSHAITVLADRDRIGQVMTNYLTNALKYSPEEQPVAVRLSTDRSVARVDVRDHGAGLPPEEQTLIWQRFHRAPGIIRQSGSGVGLGLGLYISKTIVEAEAHGGQIGVESAVGDGSTFWFSLPLAHPASPEPQPLAPSG